MNLGANGCCGFSILSTSSFCPGHKLAKRLPNDAQWEASPVDICNLQVNIPGIQDIGRFSLTFATLFPIPFYLLPTPHSISLWTHNLGFRPFGIPAAPICKLWNPF